MKNESYIVSALRTPIGSFGGELSAFSAPQLGSEVIKALIDNVGIQKDQYDEVIMGNVLSAGLGQAPARQAALLSGLYQSIECLTINKMCGSGLKAVMLADSAIKSEGANVIIAGGMESMSNAPLLMTKNPRKIGHNRMLDSMVHDGLWDAYNDMHMGSCAEMLVSKKGYTREEQDQYSIRSYQRAQDAISKGFFENELVHVDIVKKDEEPGRAKFEKIPKIKPAFEKNGTITAANASKLNDGAAAVILMSKDNVKKYNLKPLAKVVAHCSFAHEPEWFTTAPSQVIKKILSLTRLTKSDIDIWEINEAFSAVTMSAIEDFELDEARVNIHGGAVALGHPIGASGARILTTLIHALGKSNKNLGLATLCIGGGEASAMIVEKL
jgi:acetyl-CoA C-acetyltransferase|tara:strand:- start:3763 stop:4911 length:1149 start_codon:yes stop_codon:yes gene_type:complete